ncbi:EamA family transporter [Acinetobacter puyangensis]|uniref:EamA family transporter n=1 Tax=Acinetobacter puyangensis TaxID=1096779 RepID=UPI003A4D1FDB
MQHIQLMAILYMLLSMISSQFSASFAKQMITELDPITVTLFRLFFAAILVFFLFRSWRIIPRLRYLKWPDLLIFGASLALMNTLLYSALARIPQGIAVGLEFTGPLILALISITHKTDYLWLLFAMLGIILMVPWHDAIGAPLSWVGVLCALGAGFCWAIYIYYGKKVAAQDIGLHALTISLFISTLILLPIGLSYNFDALMQPQYWLKGLFIGIFAAALPYALDLKALKQLNRTVYGTLSSLSPVLAALSGWLLLSEQLSFLQWIALFCIGIASVGVTIRKPTPKSVSVE